MSGQRSKARDIACASPPGSLGKDAICPNFDRFIARMMMNFCAGEVGDFYERNRRLLHERATDQNIRDWAEKETIYFKRQGGCTALVGRQLTTEDRIRMMTEARDSAARR